MRSKLSLAAGLLAALLIVASMASAASAQDWGYSGYYGLGAHDFVPHWHNYVTPFGSYSYYGLGAHDFVPHSHYAYPYSGVSYSGYYAPYRFAYPYYYSYPYYSGPSYYYGY
jgi:hypothetical protein